ncbi:methionyl-tRNA formyltransferase [bacterium]
MIKRFFRFALKNSIFRKNNKLRVIFMGSPNASVPFLQRLIRNENVIAVFTAPDLPAGRHMKIRQTAVKATALENDLMIFQPNSLKDEKIEKQIRRLSPDIIIVVAYGHKIPDSILDIPRYKSINIHFSLLPKYRGAAPIQWALVNGEKETGVTSFYLCNRMDAGDIIYQEKMQINDSDNSEKLLEKLLKLGFGVLDKTLDLIREQKVEAIKQDNSQATLAPKMKKKDGQIDWGMTSQEILNRMKAFHPWPGSYTYLTGAEKSYMVKLFQPKIRYIEEEGNLPGEVLAISKTRGLLLKCGHGALWIKKAQMEGHKVVTGYEFFVGRKIQKGDIFES